MLSTAGQEHGKKRLNVLQKRRLEKLEKDLMNLFKNFFFALRKMLNGEVEFILDNRYSMSLVNFAIYIYIYKGKK